MNARVVYQSTTGNTKTVADAMAAAVGCTAEAVADAIISEPIDMLFLGASIHGGDVDPTVKTFIGKLDPVLVKQVTLFSTGFEQSKDKAVCIMKDLIAQRSVPVTDKYYVCRGKFLLWNRGRPNADDIAAARAFAKEQVSP